MFFGGSCLFVGRLETVVDWRLETVFGDFLNKILRSLQVFCNKPVNKKLDPPRGKILRN